MTSAARGLTALEPRTFMRRMLRDVDRWFGEGDLAFFRTPRAFDGFAWLPEVEVIEKEGKWLVHVDLPGLKKEDVNVTVTGDRLAIEGERTLETDKTEKEWFTTERTYGRFFRTFPLPEGVKPEEVKATFENGVLEVVVPVPAKALAAATRRVEIAGAPPNKEVKTAA